MHTKVFMLPIILIVSYMHNIIIICTANTLTEESSIGTLKLVDSNTSSHEAKSGAVILSQAGPGTSNQSEINQVIDAIVYNMLSSQCCCHMLIIS